MHRCWIADERHVCIFFGIASIGSLGCSGLAKRLLEMRGRALVRFVGFFCPDRWSGIVLQEEIHPVRESQLLSFPDDIQNSVVPELEAFAKFSLRLLPVFCER